MGVVTSNTVASGAGLKNSSLTRQRIGIVLWYGFFSMLEIQALRFMSLGIGEDAYVSYIATTIVFCGSVCLAIWLLLTAILLTYCDMFFSVRKDWAGAAWGWRRTFVMILSAILFFILLMTNILGFMFIESCLFGNSSTEEIIKLCLGIAANNHFILAGCCLVIVVQFYLDRYLQTEDRQSHTLGSNRNAAWSMKESILCMCLLVLLLFNAGIYFFDCMIANNRIEKIENGIASESAEKTKNMHVIEFLRRTHHDKDFFPTNDNNYYYFTGYNYATAVNSFGYGGLPPEVRLELNSIIQNSTFWDELRKMFSGDIDIGKYLYGYDDMLLFRRLSIIYTGLVLHELSRQNEHKAFEIWKEMSYLERIALLYLPADGFARDFDFIAWLVAQRLQLLKLWLSEYGIRQSETAASISSELMNLEKRWIDYYYLSKQKLMKFYLLSCVDSSVLYQDLFSIPQWVKTHKGALQLFEFNYTEQNFAVFRYVNVLLDNAWLWQRWHRNASCRYICRELLTDNTKASITECALDETGTFRCNPLLFSRFSCLQSATGRMKGAMRHTLLTVLAARLSLACFVYIRTNETKAEMELLQTLPVSAITDDPTLNHLVNDGCLDYFFKKLQSGYLLENENHDQNKWFLDIKTRDSQILFTFMF